jgi:hypothetical protein
MRYRTRPHVSIQTIIVAMLLTIGAPFIATGQLPGGVQLPGGMSLPTGGLSKDTLLTQAKELVAELLSMKQGGQLAPAQSAKVDELLPKAQSLAGELDAPQVDVAKLPQLASNLSDLQKQLGALKGLVR